MEIKEVKEVDFFDVVGLLSGIFGIMLLIIYYGGDYNMKIGIGALVFLAINIIYGIVEKLWGTFFFAFSFIVLLLNILQ